MKVIIAGCRQFENPVVFLRIIEDAVRVSQFEVTEVVSGTCEGIDTLGEIWAMSKGIPVKQFPAPWGTRGNWAGHLRNEEMAAYGEALVVVWTGPEAEGNIGHGSADMFRRARQHSLPVMEVRCTETGKVLDKKLWIA